MGSRGTGKFKKGDRVRLKVDRFDIADLRAGDVGTLREEDDGAPYVDWERIGDYWAVESSQLELVPVAEATGTDAGDKLKFKVGDRVRVADPVFLRRGTPIGAMGTITMAGDNYVEFDLDHPEDGKIGQVLSYPHDYLELVAVAQQPQPPAKEPLRIQPGRYYLTRDGRKVGPMRRWSDEAKHRWEADADDLPYIWADDGTEIASDIADGADLVAEADETQTNKEILDELEAWIAEQDAIEAAGKGSTDYGSTAGFTVPLCALEAEPDLTAIGKAYADGYAAGLQAGSEEVSDKASAAHCFRDDVDRVVLDCLKRFKRRGLLAA